MALNKPGVPVPMTDVERELAQAEADEWAHEFHAGWDALIKNMQEKK